jgi:hypothetical protein
MNEADLEYGPTPEDAEYEHTDIEPGIAGRFALWLAIAMVISGGIVYGTFWLFEGQQISWDQQVQQFPLAAGQEKEPPPPRLQTQPFKDVHLLRQEQLEKLSSYGWVDQGTGVVHIPIEDAMRIVAERNAVATTGQDAPGGFNHVVQDSSGGRTTAPR